MSDTVTPHLPPPARHDQDAEDFQRRVEEFRQRLADEEKRITLRIRRSEQLTADDLAVRINVGD